MAGYVQPGFVLFLLYLITNALLGAALSVPENEIAIALPSEGNTRRSSVCNENNKSVSCPVSCFRPDPVCGVDGITYWCGCSDAQCVGVEVAEIGFCEVGNGGSGLLSGQALTDAQCVGVEVAEIGFCEVGNGRSGRLSGKDFKSYAEVCFREFGDRVKYWITFNEANAFPILGYDLGVWPPQRCSYPFGNCSAGNSTVEPYIVGQRVLLSHAVTVELYREKFQKKQKGSIGISIYAAWFVPMTNSSEDSAATQIILDFLYGWIIEPLMYGNYPSSMRKIVGSRLPSFTKQESEKLRGSFDFIGLIHYTTAYASDAPSYRDLTPRDFLEDMMATISVYRNGIPIGELAPTGIPIVPWGMQALLEYFKGHYDNPPLIIYENGYGLSNNESLPLADALDDNPRAACLHDYLQSLLAAIRNGSNARAYFVWSLVDSFEFLYGYTIRYGLYYVDFKHRDLKRYPNLSVRWYTHFLKRYTDHRPVRSCCYDHDHSFRKEQPLLEAI